MLRLLELLTSQGALYLMTDGDIQGSPGEVRSSHDDDNAERSSERESRPGTTDGGGVRAELQRDAGGSSHREREERGADAQEPSDSSPADGDPAGRGESAEADGSPGDAVARILDALPEPERDDLARILTVLTASGSSDWSGLLPPPEKFYSFEPGDRERMMRWNDAGTVDESARQDRLVDAQIVESHRGPRRAMVVVGSCLVLAAVSGLGFENNIMGVAFLGAPLLMFAQTLLSTAGVNLRRRAEK